MKSDIELIKKHVNLNSYSSSKGYLGYFERVGQFNEEICHKAIDYFFKAFDPSNNKIYLTSSLYVDNDLIALREEYEISDELFMTYLKPLILEGAVNTVNYNELGYDYNSIDYLKKINSLEKYFVRLKVNDIGLIKKVFFSVMFIDGIKGHCFAIIEEKKIIVYPHEDIGFGFISFGCNKKSIQKYLKDTFTSEIFNIFFDS